MQSWRNPDIAADIDARILRIRIGRVLHAFPGECCARSKKVQHLLKLFHEGFVIRQQYDA